MVTGVANLKAGCLFRLREAVAPQIRPKNVTSDLRKSINLWDFLAIDERPLMIVDKQIAIANRYNSDIYESIVFKNQAFDRIAACMDVSGFLREVLDAKPASPLHLSGKTWGNYVLQDGNYIVITSEAAQCEETLNWTPAEGWRPSEAPSSSYLFQYVQTETSKYEVIKRDSIPPTNPVLDWTRKSSAPWVPEHYSEFQAVNWKDTAVGEMSGWSGSMRTVINTIMVHPYQMALYWGKEYVVIYNASYKDCVRRRHPHLLGQELAKGWKEAYDKIREHLDSCRRGISIIRSGDCAPVDRVDVDEECYFDWTLTPILEKAGNVGGVLWQQYEGTARILQDRRREMLRLLRQSTANARRTVDFWPAVLEAFDSNTIDTPFVALYEIVGDEARNLGTRGIPSGHSVAPRVIDIPAYAGLFASEIREALLDGKKKVKNNLLEYACMRLLARRGFKAPCSTAVVIPITSVCDSESFHSEAFIILGINPRRRMDDDYETWIDQIQDNISEYLAGVRNAEILVEQAMQEQLADVERRRASELSDKLREVEARLRGNELRFTELFKSIPVGLLEMDRDGAAILANAAWHEIMGVPKQGYETTWCESIHPDDRERCSRLIHAWPPNYTTISSRGHLPIEYRVMEKTDGVFNKHKVKWVVSEVLAVYDDNSKVLNGFYSTLTDITLLKLAETTQKMRADEALERTKQQERFIDMTCHELRNPLSAILQYAELILDRMDDHENQGISTIDDLADTITEACNTIILCIAHQRRIIDDILVTSKLDSGLVNVEPVDFQPEFYLRESVRMYQADAESKGIEMSFIVDQSFNDLNVKWLKGDPARIMQILSNLITNSIKFMSGRATKKLDVMVGVSLEEPTSVGEVQFDKNHSEDISAATSIVDNPQWGDGEIVYLIITVLDTGIGIEDDFQRILFSRFQQAPKTETKYGGSGLGLYICKNLVRLLGGSIDVASDKDCGAQFSFYVATRRGTKPEMEPEWLAQLSGRMANSPRNSRNTSQEPAKDSEHSPASPGSRRSSAINGFKILVVEDNVINQKVLRRQLEARGCVVFTANNGQEAVDFVRKSLSEQRAGSDAHEVEICFMDCEMPIMNGIDATKEIRRMQAVGVVSRHLPILGVSANVRGPKVQEMKDAGMDEIISKPFSIDELIRRAVMLVNAQYVESWSNEHAAELREAVGSVGLIIGEGSRKNSITEYSEHIH
ncbi:hypothetical protein BZA05DRAFT_403673 [Tricharina praecox]|uniref:uncharacterized protein n=1 Tax=Tricharina praecox TaxID=43433 RepID=UPI002220F8C0|nr:uncharacterized protein BZA05DRAFT_403673 [Tricharina praecox]KAI5848318.1 hypothetical protein BZA05DRAFT_403673 [Tricharina praecox]